MKIKSNFKDYYDHVAHVYGGGDPKFVYARLPIQSERCTLELNDNQMTELRMNRLYNHDFDHQYNYQYKYLVIAGRRYLTACKWAKNELMPIDYKLWTEKNFPEEYEHARNGRSFWSRRINYETELGGEFPVLTEIAHMINAPVYSVNMVNHNVGRNKNLITIDSNIPVLANYEIPTIITAEQLYQDLSYYVSNKMHTSPDLVVNDNQTNKEKIAGHGFDVKQSFRHRK